VTVVCVGWVLPVGCWVLGVCDVCDVCVGDVVVGGLVGWCWLGRQAGRQACRGGYGRSVPSVCIAETTYSPDNLGPAH
jgi:hypothetical protein